MKSKLFAISLILGFSLFNIGCAHRELTKYVDNNNCQTTIEGNYYKGVTSIADPPNIFLKMPKAPKLLKGILISIDSNGVTFDPDNVGFSDQDATVFPYDTLYGVIDTTGTLIFGSVPEYYAVQHKLEIEVLNLTTKDIARLILPPNEPFAYCIKEGNYKVTGIKFVGKNNVEDIGTDFPDITFEVAPGIANYLGNIYVDFKSENDENVMVIPCNRNDESRSAALGMFGLLGAVANAVATGIESSGLQHVIHIERDKNFLPELNKPIKEISLTIKKAE
jgi:hypothetical protein